jgi:hypothetical protein
MQFHPVDPVDPVRKKLFLIYRRKDLVPAQFGA